MGLSLGKTLDRVYSLRTSFLDGYYDIGVFFNKKSTFLLFKVDGDFPRSKVIEKPTKITMFKNLESSRFAETFLNLHNYRNNNLDILNQFQEIKPDYHHDVNVIFNETITVAKINIGGEKSLFDTLTLYGLTLTTYSNEFLFLIAERQNIVKKLHKKIVRTTAVQIASTPGIAMLDDFYNEKIKHETFHKNITPAISNNPDTIKLSEMDGEHD